MSTISTEGRVFVAQLTRDLAARQRRGAVALAPGSYNWRDAIKSFGNSIGKSSGPTRAAQKFRAGFERLKEAAKNGDCFLTAYTHKSRSGAFELLTYEVCKHPLIEQGNDGVAVHSDLVALKRNGTFRAMFSGPVAFMSWHALARLHERGEIDFNGGRNVIGKSGIIGTIMRGSMKHYNTAINAAGNDYILTGCLRSLTSDYKLGFYDVLTVLPRADVPVPVLAQAIAVAAAVNTYITASDDPYKLASRIPVLPFRESDYVSRSLEGRTV